MTVGSTPELRQPRFAVDATAGNHFAWFRTRLTLERMMMAWIVTAVTLIGFGFAIVQFFEQFAKFTGVEPPTRLLTPVRFGLALMGAGIAALVVAGWQYRAVLRHLLHSDFAAVAGAGRKPVYTPTFALTIIVIFVGVFAFFAVATRAL
jgi:putative membrane protein